jgi:hypothetical protein
MAASSELARATAEAFLDAATISPDVRRPDSEALVSASSIADIHPVAGQCTKVTVFTERVVSQALVEIDLQAFHQSLRALGAFYWTVEYSLLSGSAIVGFRLVALFPEGSVGLSPLGMDAEPLSMTVQPVSYWLKAMPKARDAAHCAELIAIAQYAFKHCNQILSGSSAITSVGYNTALNAAVVGLWAYFPESVTIHSAVLTSMPHLNFGKLVLDFKATDSDRPRPELFASVMLSVPVRALTDPRREIWEGLVPQEYKQTERPSREREREASRRRARGVGPDGRERSRSRSRERDREREAEWETLRGQMVSAGAAPSVGSSRAARRLW